MNRRESGKLGGAATAEKFRLLFEKKVDEYNTSPVLCKFCKSPLEYKKRKNTFCNRSCAASFNNSKYPKVGSGRIEFSCLYCNTILKKLSTSKQRFCTKKCAGKHTVRNRIQVWLESEDETYYVKAAKQYILEQQEHRCAVCNMKDVWNDRPIVFILDHIDGNSDHNRRLNLRCVCPNCDSQLDTYKSKNRGKGRHKRRQRYAEGKSF